jgi:adenylate cyclase
MQQRRLTFGPFEFDRASGTVSQAGKLLSVGPRGGRLLEALLARPGEVLTKAELMDAVWPGRAVEESNLSVQIAQLRKALGNGPDGSEWIETVPRVGYRFLGEIRSAEAGAAARALDDEAGPSLAILPFTVGADPDQGLFADGLVEDIINTLSKLSGLTVIARNSSFAYKGTPVDVRRAARELGVRYVMEGSLHKSGSRVRITVQLTDAEHGGAIWSERYDRAFADIFTIQDEIALSLATEMQVLLLQGEEARLRYTTTTNVEAWTWWVRGLAAVAKPTPAGENLAHARQYWEKALASDPTSAALHAEVAFTYALAARYAWQDRTEALEKAKAHVHQALALNPDPKSVALVTGLIHVVERRFDEAIAVARGVIKHAPFTASGAMWTGYILAVAGLAAEAVVQFERARKLNPRSHVVLLGLLGNAYRLTGRTEEAIALLEELSARAPNLGGRDLVIAYMRAGRRQEGLDAARRLLAAAPDFTIANWVKTQFRGDTVEFEADIAALRSAGLPE